MWYPLKKILEMTKSTTSYKRDQKGEGHVFWKHDKIPSNGIKPPIWAGLMNRLLAHEQATNI